MIAMSKQYFYTGLGLSRIGRTEDEWKAAQREAARKELVRADKENQRQMAEWYAVAWRNNLNG